MKCAAISVNPLKSYFSSGQLRQGQICTVRNDVDHTFFTIFDFKNILVIYNLRATVRGNASK